ncbi:MAG TPA: hypothetical protein VGJ09_20600 [Bryobacteraceae bacterium]
MVRFFVFLLILRFPLAAQSDPAILQIHIVEGEGAVYPIGTRATRGVTVQVTDETGKPVESAAVSFRLPDEGPTGAFSSGMRTEIATTGVDGRASAWGMQWNRVTGPLEVRITAAKGQARAGTVCGLFLSDAASKEPRTTSSGGWRSHRKIWLGVAVAAAAFASVAAVTSRGSPSGTAAGTVNAPQIGTPTIIIGKP